MSDMAEDRVYDDHAAADVAYLATGTGLAEVRVANGRVGRFRVAHRGTARDVAAVGRDGGQLVAVATNADVLVHHPDLRAGGWVSTGFGPAAAVGLDETADGAAVVAVDSDDHAIKRVLDPGSDPSSWLAVADVDAPIRAVDGPFLAAADGVYRVTPDGVDNVGLTDVRDVAAAGPKGAWPEGDALAAAADGCHLLAPGVQQAWSRELDGAFDAVAAAGDRAVAAGDDGAYVHGAVAGEETPAGWRSAPVPATPADVGVGARAYAVTGDGTFFAREAGGWRRRTLGFPEVAAMAVVPG